MTFAMIYMAFGLILVIFAGELTSGDRFAVRTYQVFPLLKKLPRSNLAATSLNYRATYCFLKAMGALLTLAGLLFLGMEVLRRR
jgi:hypothetical protein